MMASEYANRSLVGWKPRIRDPCTRAQPMCEGYVTGAEWWTHELCPLCIRKTVRAKFCALRTQHVSLRHIDWHKYLDAFTRRSHKDIKTCLLLATSASIGAVAGLSVAMQRKGGNNAVHFSSLRGNNKSLRPHKRNACYPLCVSCLGL